MHSNKMKRRMTIIRKYLEEWLSSEEHLLSSIPQHVLQELDAERLMEQRVKSAYVPKHKVNTKKFNSMLPQLEKEMYALYTSRSTYSNQYIVG